MGEQFIYAAREIDTKKLRSDLTNPRRKYWDREWNCKRAVDYYNERTEAWGCQRSKLEVVKFKLVEVPR